MDVNNNIGVFGKVAETEAINVEIENSLGKTKALTTSVDKKTVCNSQSIDALVAQSLARTEIVSTPVKSTMVANTQTIEMPIVKSLCSMQNKNCFLNGGVTKSANVALGGDNIVYANVRIAEGDNAISLRDDGLFVKNSNWTASADDNVNFAIDNDAQAMSLTVINSPRLNNKLEYELEVNSAQNYAVGGNIEQNFNAKVDKVNGKGLSECDFSAIEKVKLGNIDTDKYINLINYDSVNHKLTLNKDSQTSDVPLLGLLTDAKYDATSGRLTFGVANGNEINIDIPKDNFVSSGAYNTASKEIELTLANGGVVKIPAHDIAIMVSGAESSSVKLSVDSSNCVTAIVKVSNAQNNALNVNADGIYVAKVDRNSLDIANVDNTADLAKPISLAQKEYVDSNIDSLKNFVSDSYIKKAVDGNLQIKSVNGKIIFFINGLAQMEISSEGVNFLV